jgi:DNA transformation protein
MAVSESFLTFVLEQLGGLRGLTTKRMFGGVGVYCDETFFAILDNGTLYFKVDAELATRYQHAGMPPFQPIAGKPPMTSYYQVPPGVLEDADELAEWARRSIERARHSGRGPRRRRR